MVKICATIVVYRDPVGLKRCLESLKDFDKVYVLDGKYPVFNPPHDELPYLSVDGTRAVAQEYSNVELIDFPAPQNEKRNRGLELAHHGGFNWCLIIDSDEWLHDFDRDLVISQLNSQCHNKKHFFGCKLSHDQGNSHMVAHRWIHHPNEVEHYMIHTMWRVKGTSIIMEHPIVDKEIKGMSMWHDDTVRPQAHMLASQVYQAWKSQWETEVRRTWKTMGGLIDTRKEP